MTLDAAGNVFVAGRVNVPVVVFSAVENGILAAVNTSSAGTGSPLFSFLTMPVMGSLATQTAATSFIEKIKGSGVSTTADMAVWLSPDGWKASPTPVWVEGSAAPGTGGAKFSSFKDLAMLPGYGPIFTASLQLKTGTPRSPARVTSAFGR